MIPRFLVVHCSDSPNDRDIGAAEIHRWHKERTPPFDGIGYHAVIRRDGTVENGRPVYWQGAHVAGHNHESLGVCLVGRDEFTDAQYTSLEGLLQAWHSHWPDARVVGHYHLDSSKTCPNFDAEAWWHEHNHWG